MYSIIHVLKYIVENDIGLGHFSHYLWIQIPELDKLNLMLLMELTWQAFVLELQRQALHEPQEMRLGVLDTFIKRHSGLIHHA